MSWAFKTPSVDVKAELNLHSITAFIKGSVALVSDQGHTQRAWMTSISL